MLRSLKERGFREAYGRLQRLKGPGQTRTNQDRREDYRRLQKNTETKEKDYRRLQKNTETKQQPVQFRRKEEMSSEGETDAKMAGSNIEIKIVKEEEGSGINWAEEVETADPAGWSEYKEDIWQRKPAKAVVKKEIKIKKDTTYPYEVRLGSYLKLKEGEEGMRRLRKEGIKNEQQLEMRYMEEVLRKPGVCKNPTWVQFQKFDVETLGEKEVKTLIRSSESGLMIKSRYYPGKTEHYVVLLAMSPVQEVPRKATEEKESQGDTEIIRRTEVRNC